MISKAFVTNRDDAQYLVDKFKHSGNNVCWITICGKGCCPLVPRSSKYKHVFVSIFDDVRTNALTTKQARKIKNFIINHHVNMKESFILVINCFHGISRSAAIGMFCKHTLSIGTIFGPVTFPNTCVMRSLGMSAAHWVPNVATWDRP